MIAVGVFQREGEGEGGGGVALRFRAARFLKTPQTAALPEKECAGCAALGFGGADLR